MILAAALAMAGASGCGSTPTCDGSVRARLARSDGTVSGQWCVGLATTEAEREAGLSGVPPLESGEGLVLEFPIEGEVCITNAPVDYAIDVVFAGADGAVRVAKCDVPAHDASFTCVPQVMRVLEVRAGEACPVPASSMLQLD